MSIANHEDIVHVFPGIQDHAVVEILEMKATVDELEAALAIMSGDEKDSIGIRQREGGQIHRLLGILDRAGVQQGDED